MSGRYSIQISDFESILCCNFRITFDSLPRWKSVWILISWLLIKKGYCTSFVDLLCFCSVLCLLCFVRVCLYVLRGHLLGKGWPLGSRLWCLLWVCHFPIGILGQVWYLIVSIPDLCSLTYFYITLIKSYVHCNRIRFKNSHENNYSITWSKKDCKGQESIH